MHKVVALLTLTVNTYKMDVSVEVYPGTTKFWVPNRQAYAIYGESMWCIYKMLTKMQGALVLAKSGRLKLGDSILRT